MDWVVVLVVWHPRHLGFVHLLGPENESGEGGSDGDIESEGNHEMPMGLSVTAVENLAATVPCTPIVCPSSSCSTSSCCSSSCNSSSPNVSRDRTASFLATGSFSLFAGRNLPDRVFASSGLVAERCRLNCHFVRNV